MDQADVAVVLERLLRLRAIEVALSDDLLIQDDKAD